MTCHGMATGRSAEVSTATTRMAATPVLGERSRPGSQSECGQAGKYEGRTKRSRSFHNVTQ
jgi:hypothetical protein